MDCNRIIKSVSAWNINNFKPLLNMENLDSSLKSLAQYSTQNLNVSISKTNKDNKIYYNLLAIKSI